MADVARSDVDDPPERGPTHERQPGAHAPDHRHDTRVERVEPFVVGELVDASEVRGTGRVHDRVELAPSLLEVGERRLHLARVEEIALQPERVG